MSALGRNIKTLRKQFDYNQKDLAELLGVSQTSVAHYEAGTRQPTIETLMMLSQIFEESIDRLVGHSMITGRNKYGDIISISELVESLTNYLVEKDEESFLEVFERNVFPNYDINQVLDSVLKKVMYRIGDLWEQGKITEADEHYATNIVRKALHFINFNMEKTLKSKKAISLIVGSEKHSLGIEMINTVLETEGVESLFLGGNLPIRSIEKAIKDNEPNYIFISVTLKDHYNSVEQLVEYINDKFNGKMTIIIGGQGITEYKSSTEQSNIHVLKDITEVKEFLLKD